MDQPDVDPRALRQALDHVAAVNRWLGGRRALLLHLPEALRLSRGHDTGGGQPRDPGPFRILDVGTGSGDLPMAVARWARKRDLAVEVTGIDLHDRTLRVAARRTAQDPAVRVLRGDGLRLPFAEGAFDVALLSMTLHHMDGPALLAILRELGRVARQGRVLVSELERCLPNYLGARLLGATLWRRNPITRHDGPLSVLRAFTPAELLELAGDAGLPGAHVHRHPFHRLVLLADGGGQPPRSRRPQ